MTPYLKYRQQLKNGQVNPVEKKPRKKIAPYSKKREKLNREYAKESKPFWNGKQCEIRSPVCTQAAQGIHHRKGKATAKELMDKRYWMAACNHCNSYIENADAWARQRGFKVSRLTK
jgi:hypothetical protein